MAFPIARIDFTYAKLLTQFLVAKNKKKTTKKNPNKTKTKQKQKQNKNKNKKQKTKQNKNIQGHVSIRNIQV